jgi:hypothetical protein
MSGSGAILLGYALTVLPAGWAIAAGWAWPWVAAVLVQALLVGSSLPRRSVRSIFTPGPCCDDSLEEFWPAERPV